MITMLRNFGPLANLPLTNERLMLEIGLLATRMIRMRTERGQSVSGGSFRPLSPAYAEAKQKALGHTRADLTVSGRMLNDMRAVETTRNSVTIGFGSRGGGGGRGTFIQRSRAMGAADKAFFHHVSGAGKSRVKREFFDLSGTELDEIQRKIEQYQARVLKGEAS